MLADCVNLRLQTPFAHCVVRWLCHRTSFAKLLFAKIWQNGKW